MIILLLAAGLLLRAQGEKVFECVAEVSLNLFSNMSLFPSKGCWNNATEAEKSRRRREKQHKVQVNEDEFNFGAPRSPSILPDIYKNGSAKFLSRLKGPGSNILPCGKWHLIFIFVFGSVVLHGENNVRVWA